MKKYLYLETYFYTIAFKRMFSFLSIKLFDLKIYSKMIMFIKLLNFIAFVYSVSESRIGINFLHVF